MIQQAHFIAADLGASSGRLMLGQWDGQRFAIQELHRFPNEGVHLRDGFYWDILGIWAQIKAGLAKYHSLFPGVPEGIAVDAWGVDFGLLDRSGNLLGNVHHYRDPRTHGMPERVFDLIPEHEWFAESGVQSMAINTLFQLYSMVEAGDASLASAETLLMVPDLFTYFLCGERSIEWSAASTTGMYSMARSAWLHELLERIGIPTKILPRVVKPGIALSPVDAAVLKDSGIGSAFRAVAVGAHDTASAVLAIPNLGDDCVFLSSGTWSLMGIEASTPDTSERARELGFTNEGAADGNVLLLKNLTGLWIVQECLRQWESEGMHIGWDALVAAAQAAKPLRCVIDPDASVFQASCDMPNAIRQYCAATGQAAPQDVGEVVRCVYESLALKYRSVLDSLRLLTGRALKTMCIAGGGCRNAMLCQMAADACGCRVMSGPAEASTLGNVMLQAVATGHLPDVAAGRSALADSVERTFYEPHPNDRWEQMYLRFHSLEVNGANCAAAHES